MSQIPQFLISYGELFLFLIAFAEQCGLPAPGAPLLMAAGALAASGRLALIAVIGWTAVGRLAADATWFCLGQRRKAFVFRVFPHLHSVQSRLHQATLAQSILRGAWMLTVAKFLPFGTVVPLHAGALEVGSLRFMLVDAFSSAVYAAVYALLGFVFHSQLEQALAFMRKLGEITLPVVVGLALAWFVYWSLKRRKTSAPPTSSQASQG